jgi:hypothetical protein
VVDATSEAALQDEAALAIRVYASPCSCSGTVAPPALRFPSAEDASGIANRSSDAIPGEEKVEQCVQEMFPALFRIARPNDQGALRVRGCYGKFPGAFVSPVEAMDKRRRYPLIEIEIEVAHGGSPSKAIKPESPYNGRRIEVLKTPRKASHPTKATERWSV